MGLGKCRKEGSSHSFNKYIERVPKTILWGPQRRIKSSYMFLFHLPTSSLKSLYWAL